MNASTRFTAKSFWLFTALTLGFSWACWFFVALSGVDINTSLEAGVVTTLGGFGPLIVGIFMVHRSGDAEYIREYRRRVFDFRRIKTVWYASILFLYPVTVVLTFLLLRTAVDVSPLREMLLNPGTFGTTIIFVFLFGPLSEELGWRGYVLDNLQSRHSALVSSLIIGVVWWAWHLPLLAVRGSFLYENGLDLVFLAGYLYVVIIYSILFTWICNNNRSSVLAAILIHFSINLTSRVIVMPAEIFTFNSFVLVAVLVYVLWRYGPKSLVRDAKLGSM